MHGRYREHFFVIWLSFINVVHIPVECTQCMHTNTIDQIYSLTITILFNFRKKNV